MLTADSGTPSVKFPLNIFSDVRYKRYDHSNWFLLFHNQLNSEQGASRIYQDAPFSAICTLKLTVQAQLQSLWKADPDMTCLCRCS